MSDPRPPRSGEAAKRAGEGRLSGEELRRATFPQALRGYDREAVHSLLDRVADWVEQSAGKLSGQAPQMKQELAKVGERTAGILTAAEETAQRMRDEAAEYAERLRADADDEARKAKLNASQRMDEMIRDAEQKAERIINEAIARRRKLNQAISGLVERRDEIAGDVHRLAEDLLDAVEAIKGEDPSSTELEAAPKEDEDGTPTEAGGLEPEEEELESMQLDADEAETRVHRTGGPSGPPQA